MAPDIDLLDLNHAGGSEMCAHLWSAAEVIVFEAGKVIVKSGDRLHCMFVVVEGVVRCVVPTLMANPPEFLDHSSQNCIRSLDVDRVVASMRRVEDVNKNKVVDLNKGQSLGMWSLMGDDDPSSPFGFPVAFIANSNLKVSLLRRSAVEDIAS